MSLSPIGSAVFELLSRKHTDRQTSYYFIVRIYYLPLEYFHLLQQQEQGHACLYRH